MRGIIIAEAKLQGGFKTMEKVLRTLTGIKGNMRFMKYSANLIFLSISCFLVSNLLTQLSDRQNVKYIYLALTIGLEVLVQYIIGLAKGYWKI